MHSNQGQASNVNELETVVAEVANAVESKKSSLKTRLFKNRTRRAKVGLAFMVSVVATLLLGTIASAAGAINPIQNGVIYSCFNADNGKDLRLINPTNNCKRNEQLLTWNQQGPKGDTGPAGPQGPKGDTGAQGLQGLKGDTGAQGPKGDTGAQGPQGLKGDTGAQGPVGPQGPKGDTGAQGPTAPSTISYVRNSSTVAGLVAQEIRTFCPAGKQPISGGYFINFNQTLQANVRVSASNPVSDANGNYWRVVVLNYNDPNQPGTTLNINTYAVCETLAPGVNPGA
ncbi:MAG TPA: hypothetical protein VH186_14085 [Chloroflexia bacterium]|nr:hypothetical protein [Chloroflexia bacterium]